MNAFIFLYPIQEYFENSFGYHPAYAELFKTAFNRCIDARYRQTGFEINFVLFDDTSTSDIIDLEESDKILKAGLAFKEHITKRDDGTYPYPDPDYVLDQLEDVEHLRVAGFHLWDCVDIFAQHVYERGIDVLVDEDLTEMFSSKLMEPGADVSKYPSYNPRQDADHFFDIFMNARKNRPWLWQDY